LHGITIKIGKKCLYIYKYIIITQIFSLHPNFDFSLENLALLRVNVKNLWARHCLERQVVWWLVKGTLEKCESKLSWQISGNVWYFPGRTLKDDKNLRTVRVSVGARTSALLPPLPPTNLLDLQFQCFFAQASASWCCWPLRWSGTCLCATLDATSPSWGHHVSSCRSSPSWHSCYTSPTSFAMNSNPVSPRLKGRSLTTDRTTDASSTPSSTPCIRYVAMWQPYKHCCPTGVYCFDFESLDRFFLSLWYSQGENI
jgi:hypothetical protein